MSHGSLSRWSERITILRYGERVQRGTVEGMLMDVPSREFVLAGSLEELKAKGRLVLHDVGFCCCIGDLSANYFSCVSC